MIIECMEIIVDSSKREDVRRALTLMLGPTEAEAGCLSCRLYQLSANSNAFRFEAHWRDHPDLVRHIQAVRYRDVLELMEMSVEPPRLDFHVVSESLGLGFIAEIRRPAHGGREEDFANTS